MSQLARELGLSRSLLYLHLQKLEEAELVTSEIEILESGKAAKYYMLKSFQKELNEQLVHKLAISLSAKKKNNYKGEKNNE